MAIGSFSAFTQARLGIYAATKGLTVTGNNISNINTVGYTRQALDQVSLRNGGADRYQSSYNIQIGNGALVRSVSQLRDPYLDIRYRTESSIVGYTNTTLENMTYISDILDEVGKGKGDHEGDGVIFAQFSDFLSSLQQLNTDAAAQANDTLARASADTLTSLFHFYADKLEGLQKDTSGRLKQEVAGLNGVLASIQDLNVAIRKSEIHGDPALEMRDERNNLIDQLSEYVKIDVIYTMEDVGAGQQVEKLTIKLGNANPDPDVETDSTILIDGIYARRFDMPESFPVENDQYDKDFVPANDPPDPTADIKAFKYLKTDENGVVTGTNDPAEADQIPNSNYDLFLTKLLDTKGREWSNILSSSVSKVADPNDAAAEPGLVGAPVKAVYAFTVGGTITQGETIKIGGKEYKLPQSVDTADKLAAFIAARLPANDSYDISSNGADVIFTAKIAGAVKAEDQDGTGPEEAITLTLEPGDPPTQITLLPNAALTVQGKNADPDWKSTSSETLDDGSKLLTSYTMRGADWYKTVINVEYSQQVDLDDNDLYGSIQAFRESLTEAGEFSTADTVENIDENAATKRGIPYYRHCLDLLAKVFAETFNEANNGYAVDQDGNYLTKDGATIELAGAPLNKSGLTQDQIDALVADGCVVMQADGVTPALDEGGNKIPDLERFLGAKDANKMGGNLFSIRGDLDDGEGITAANISVSRSWANGDVHIVNTFTKLFGGDITNTTQDNNIGHMISLMSKKLRYIPADLVEGSDSTHLFQGSFQDMLINMSSVLGNDKREVETQLDTAYTYQIEMDTSRDSVSAVDLNDEAMNLMQYAKSLNAAYRLMTTIDEALDRLINNTGVVGR